MWDDLGKNVTWLPFNNDGENPLQIPDDWWSTDIAKGFTKFGGSCTPMVQLAEWMGFDPIYLLGIDANWKPFENGKDPNHFVDDYGHGSNPTEGRVMWWNEAARKSHAFIARNATSKIYNATVGGAVEAYPRVDINDLF